MHQAQLRLAAQVLEVRHLERLQDHRRGLAGVAVAGQRVEQAILELESQAGVIGRVLGFDIRADAASQARALASGQIEHLLEGGNPEFAVVRLVALGERLNGTQGLEFGEGEVRDEPALFLDAIDHSAGLAAGELGAILDVGGAGDIGLVARHQHAIAGRHQVGLDEVGPQFDGFRIALQGVVRQVTGGAAVANHQRLVAVQRGVLRTLAAAVGRQRQCGAEGQGHGSCSESGHGSPLARC
ncbi:hypothetical protein D3C78_1196760 [compost metagenome]